MIDLRSIGVNDIIEQNFNLYQIPHNLIPIRNFTRTFQFNKNELNSSRVNFKNNYTIKMSIWKSNFDPQLNFKLRPNTFAEIYSKVQP